MTQTLTDSIRGYVGVGVFEPKTSVNVGTLWRSAHAFGADFLFTIGARYSHQPSDTTKAARHVPLWAFDEFRDFLNAMPIESTLVAVELADESIPLTRFEHPERAIYLLGAEDYGLPLNVLDNCPLAVNVPGAARCLNVATAGSIVLYDRFRRGVR